MVVPKVTDGLEGGATIPRAPVVPANTNPTNSPPPALASSRRVRGRGRRRDWLLDSGGGGS